MSAGLRRRLDALEACQAPDRPDYKRLAMIEALAEVDLSDGLERALEIERKGLPRSLVALDPRLPALFTGLWMERQGMTYLPGDEWE